jgi:Fe-S-cluster-containing dehydrogenase component
MRFDRRSLFKLAGAAGGAALAGTPAEAAVGDPDETYAVLVDLTQCAGCRNCEASCAEANGLPEPDWSDDFSYEKERSTTETQWTAVNRYVTSRGEVFVKRQCMHCVTPACAAGCLTKALYKTDEGPVIWREPKCMGCRYCMVSCPFDVPKFEYHSAVPKIQKCRMCFERVADGGTPACVENCPQEALTFGKRGDLLRLARERIVQNPGQYVDHVYGEHEAGGTGFLYLSPVPFAELGFRTDLGSAALPETTRDFLTAVPMVLVVWPAMMLALRRATAPAEDAGEAEDGARELPHAGAPAGGYAPGAGGVR